MSGSTAVRPIAPSHSPLLSFVCSSTEDEDEEDANERIQIALYSNLASRSPAIHSDNAPVMIDLCMRDKSNSLYHRVFKSLPSTSSSRDNNVSAKNSEVIYSHQRPSCSSSSISLLFQEEYCDFQEVIFRNDSVVLRATYGPEATPDQDVTKKVQKLISTGKMHIVGGIHQEIGDPNPGVAKKFRVWYQQKPIEKQNGDFSQCVEDESPWSLVECNAHLMASAPCLASSYSSHTSARLDCFFLSHNHRVAHRYFDRSFLQQQYQKGLEQQTATEKWSVLREVGDPQISLVGTPAAVSPGVEGELFVFSRGLDRRLKFMQSVDFGLNWTCWVPVEGPEHDILFDFSPAVCHCRQQFPEDPKIQNYIYIFGARYPEQDLCYTIFDPRKKQRRMAWHSLGGGIVGTPSLVIVPFSCPSEEHQQDLSMTQGKLIKVSENDKWTKFHELHPTGPYFSLHVFFLGMDAQLYQITLQQSMLRTVGVWGDYRCLGKLQKQQENAKFAAVASSSSAFAPLGKQKAKKNDEKDDMILYLIAVVFNKRNAAEESMSKKENKKHNYGVSLVVPSSLSLAVRCCHSEMQWEDWMVMEQLPW